MSKVYLCGITSKGDYENIKRLIKSSEDSFDGLIFVYDADTNSLKKDKEKCFQFLNDNKKGGKIICRPFTRDHDIQMSEFLRRGPLELGDWFIIRDSVEIFNPEWAKNIKTFLNSCDLQGVRSVYNHGKGFAFKWNDSMIFQGNPHWGLQGAQGKSIDLKDYFDEGKKEHTWRPKDGEEGGRPIDNKIKHEAKYAWVYGRSNHLLLGYENRIEEFQRAEMIRLHIREVARLNNFDMTIEGLEEFMKYLEETDYNQFKSWINSHRVWKNFYRYIILGVDFSVVDSEENSWILT